MWPESAGHIEMLQHLVWRGLDVNVVTQVKDFPPRIQHHLFSYLTA